MIILDTNVVSETIKTNPEPRVLEWLNSQHSDTLFLSSITVAELSFGIAALPEGQRKIALEQTIERTTELFKDRTLPFDQLAACHYGQLMADARSQGHALSMADGCICAIAKAHNAIVASRDTGPFHATNTQVINPWIA
jgi:predicted nucleic acid-binding protein